MSGLVVVLWLGTAATRPNATPELDSWARARLVRIEDARAAPTAPAEYDDALVRRIEELIEQARVAADAMDEDAANARLGEASRFIDDHPELPQAAWLSAERMMLEAALRDRRSDGLENARALRRAASALEGQRVAPLAEAAKPPAPESTAPEPAKRIAIGGLEPDDQLFWMDGQCDERSPLA